MIKLLQRNHKDDYANLVLDFTPDPKYQGTYDRTNGRIILRVGNFGNHEIDDFFGVILWTIVHESIHIALYNMLPPGYNKFYNDEWYQVAGMDYLEDYFHTIRLIMPMEKCYSELAPNAFKFRTQFDVNFIARKG